MDVEFQELCAAIRRNDPSLSSVMTNRADCDMMRTGYGLRLSAAFRNNSVVTELDLNLAHFLSPTERNNRTFKAAEPLLQWIKSTHSLKTVKLSYSTRRRRNHAHECQALTSPVDIQLVERLLQAMAHSNSIQTVETYLSTNIMFPMPIWTAYLSSENAIMHLQSLRIIVEPTMSHDSSLELARAIGALSNLQVLVHVGAFGGLVLQHLVSRAATLRELTVNMSFMRLATDDAAAAAAASFNKIDPLCNVLTTCTGLESVSLANLELKDETWPPIAAALQSNPTKIASLKLEYCQFSQKAWRLFAKFMRDTGDICNAESQPPRPRQFKLHLIQCKFIVPDNDAVSAHKKIVCMLRGGSKLQHLTVDLRTLDQQFGRQRENEGEILRFSKAMAKASSSSSNKARQIRLESLQLDGFECRDLLRLSRYLSSTAHLRRLRVEVRHTGINDVHNQVLKLPHGFLAILRANGSLESVEIRDETYKERRPSSSLRVMDAIAARNRLLPQLLPASLMEKDVTDVNHGAAPVASAKKRLSVTLCQAAQQAPRLAPNNVLKGLLAASDNAIGSTTSSSGAKRVAGG